MFKKFFLIMVALFTISAIEVSAKKEVPFNYELEAPKDAYNSSQDGWQVIKVWSMGKQSDITSNIGCRNAIHGLIFKGLSWANQDPLCPEGYEAHKDYFDQFFANEGNYMQFIELTNKGAQQAGDVINCGKYYKIGLLVKVNIAQLMKRLQADGIIKNSFESVFEE